MPMQSKKLSVYRTASAILGIATALWLVSYCATVGTFSAAHAAPDESRAAPASVEKTVRSYDRHDSIRDQLEQLSENEIKLFYTRCSQESAGRRLDGGEAMGCSIGYDILLRKHFTGDFEQLLLWSHSGRAAAQ